MSLSIIIPTKNEEKNIEPLLKILRAQTLQPDEIIVADASTDRTPDIARDYGCKVVEGDGSGHLGLARNKGAKHSKSDILFFLDADTFLLRKDFIEVAVHHFNNNDLNIASCYLIPKSSSIISFFYYTWSNFVRFFSGIFRRPFKVNEAVIITRRKVWKALGGFSEEKRFEEGRQFFKDAIKSGYKYDMLPLRVKTCDKRTRVFTLKDIRYSVIFVLGKIWGGRFKVQSEENFAERYWESREEIHVKDKSI